ncbi:hypothetical protein FRAHR75_70005 [Frankia sp. Hr75.2]|nr:hypothetical protein FRAHR75_70005 [Frankia sp. Hr75.2]
MAPLPARLALVRGPAWQVRVVLVTAEQVAVGYRLPVVEILPTAQENRVVGHLARTSSATTGTSTAPSPTCAPSRPGRSAQRCSTNGCWPVWATSGGRRRASSPE